MSFFNFSAPAAPNIIFSAPAAPLFLFLRRLRRLFSIFGACGASVNWHFRVLLYEAQAQADFFPAKKVVVYKGTHFSSPKKVVVYKGTPKITWAWASPHPPGTANLLLALDKISFWG